MESLAKIRAAAGAALLLAPTVVSAELVDFEFSGTITMTFGTIGAKPASSFAGQPFDGHFVIESEASDAVPGDPVSGVYFASVPPLSFAAQIGATTVAVPSLFYVNVIDESVPFGGDSTT